MVRVLIISLLLSGCASTHVAHITTPIDDGFRPSVQVCTTGKSRPDLDQVIVDWHDKIGVDATVVPLPEKYLFADAYRLHEYDDGAKERAALRVVMIVPDCQIVFEYVGGGAGCIMGQFLVGFVPCQQGGMYSRDTRLDAAGFARLLTPNTVRHEIAHAWGCDHEHSEAECRESIRQFKLVVENG